MQWDHEPQWGKLCRDSALECGSPLPLSVPRARCESARGLAQSKTWRHFGRFMESRLSLFRVHRDHERQGRARRRASVLECASPLALSRIGAPSKSARGLAQSKTWRQDARFMESRPSLFRMHRDHERDRNAAFRLQLPARATPLPPKGCVPSEWFLESLSGSVHRMQFIARALPVPSVR